MCRATEWKLAGLGVRVKPLLRPPVQLLITLGCSWIPSVFFTVGVVRITACCLHRETEVQVMPLKGRVAPCIPSKAPSPKS